MEFIGIIGYLIKKYLKLDLAKPIDLILMSIILGELALPISYLTTMIRDMLL